MNTKTQPANRDPIDIPDIQRDEALEKHQVSGIIPYQTAKLTINLGEKQFHTLPVPLVASWVSEIVKVESPVHVSEVMCDAAGIKRVGSRIQDTIEKSFSVLSEVNRKGDFLWLSDMGVPVLRDRSDPKLNKKVQLIAPEEIAQAVLKVVKDSYGADVDNVAPSAFQALGFARVTDEMKELVKPIISDLIKDGILNNKGKILVMGQ